MYYIENTEYFNYFWSVLLGGIRGGFPEEVPRTWIWGNKSHRGEDVNPAMIP